MSQEMENKQIKKLPTSADVAKLAGVSRATVSAYINGTRFVSDKSIQKVDRAIEKLNYTPNEIARSLKLQNNKAIGLLIPVLSKFYLPMIRSINEKIHEHGYTMLLGSSEEDIDREKEILQVFTSNKVSGVLIVPCGDKNANYINQLQESGISFVQLNRHSESIISDSVVSDMVEAIYDATKFLVEKRDKKRIALLGYNPDIISDSEKREGYLKAVSEFGFESIVMETREHALEKLQEEFDEFFTQNKIDGIVCTTRTYMEAAYGVLKKKNIKMPANVSVIGYDDPVWTQFVTPKLSVLSENRFEMGDKAVELLFDRIEEKHTGKPQNIRMKADLIVRES